MWRPQTVSLICSTPCARTAVKDAMAGKVPQKWRDYAKGVNDQSEQLMTLARPVPHQVGRWGNGAHSR